MSESITTSWKEIYTKTVNYATYHVWAKVESQSVSKNSSVVRTSMIISMASGSSMDTDSFTVSLTGCSSRSVNTFTRFTGERRLIPADPSEYGKITVSHDSNGNGSVTIKAKFSPSYSSYAFEASIDCVLPKIDRIGIATGISGSSVTSVWSVDYTKYVDSFTHILNMYYKSGDTLVKLFEVPGYVSGSEFRLSDYTKDSKSVDDYILRNTTTVKSISICASITTKNGSTVIAESDMVSKTIDVGTSPNVTNQTVTEMAISENITVKEMSVKNVTATCVANDYASITSVVVSAGGAVASLRPVSGSSYAGTITGMVAESSTIDYVITATDSRGRKTSKTITQDYYEYTAPIIESATFVRVGNPSDPSNPFVTDAVGRISFKINYTNILSNRITVVVSGGLGSGSVTDTGNGTFEYTMDFPNADYRRYYSMAITVEDSFGGRDSSGTLKLPVEQPVLNIFDDEVNISGTMFVSEISFCPVADFTDSTSYELKVPHLSKNRAMTGLLIRHKSLWIITVERNKTVVLSPVSEVTSGFTLTGSVSGETLTITASGTCTGGIRILWMN